MKNQITRRRFLRRSGTAVVMAPALLPALTAAEAKVIHLDGTKLGRTFEGIGALSAGASSRLLIDYPEPQRSQVLDLLFKPGFGASLHHFKVEIGGDANSTDGTEPSHMHSRDDLSFERGYEWWLMKEARRRNPRILLDSLAWGAPGWIGGGNYYSPDLADYIVKFLKGAQEAHGLEINYTGIWNEVAYDKEWIKLFKRTLRANGLGAQLVAADQTPFSSRGLWGIAEDMRKDPELTAAVDVVGVHYPFYKNYRSTETARGLGKPLWASEDGFSQKRVSCDDFSAALWLARFFNMNYIGGRMTKTIVWSLVSSYYDNFPYRRSGLMVANAPWSGHFEDSAPLWAVAHTTQFAQPGWQYLDSACRRMTGGGSCVALKCPDSGDYSIVIETAGARLAQNAVFQISGGLSEGSLSIWRTRQGESFSRIGEARPSAGEFFIELEPQSIYSLTTIHGQQKGGYAAPPAAEFPLPYADDFSGYPLGAFPRFFSDWFGVFAVGEAEGRPCLVQEVLTKPIDWGFVKNGNPRSFIGGDNWRDYAVSVEADLSSAGQVSLFGRMSKIAMSNLPSQGFELRLPQTGKWSLLAGARKIKQGRVEAKSGWRRLGMKFVGNRVRAMVDGREVANGLALQSGSGLAGIGSGFGPGRFRDFRVDPV